MLCLTCLLSNLVCACLELPSCFLGSRLSLSSHTVSASVNCLVRSCICSTSAGHRVNAWVQGSVSRPTAQKWPDSHKHGRHPGPCNTPLRTSPAARSAPGNNFSWLNFWAVGTAWSAAFCAPGFNPCKHTACLLSVRGAHAWPHSAATNNLHLCASGIINSHEKASVNLSVAECFVGGHVGSGVKLQHHASKASARCQWAPASTTASLCSSTCQAGNTMKVPGTSRPAS